MNAQPAPSPQPAPPTTYSPPNRARPKTPLQRAGRATQLAAAKVSFAVVGAIAPRAAGRAGAKLWCTVPAGAGRRKDNRTIVGRTESITAPDGIRLAVEIWGEGPRVYIMHGWGGWRGQLGAFVEPLVDAGFQVIGCDAASHGESDPGEFGPKYSTGGDIVRALLAAVDHYGPAAAVVAHSLGCSAASQAALADGAVGRLVLVSPSPDLGPFLVAFGRRIGAGRRATEEMSRIVVDMAHRPLEQFDVINVGAKRKMPPTLVIHDRDDKESPFSTSEALVASWEDARLVSTQSLGHQRILLDDDVVANAVRFVSQVQ